VEELTIKECLSKHGATKSVRDELWAAAYRNDVYNGIRIVEIKLKRHLSSHMSIAGYDALISHDGQPPTCYRFNETGLLQIDCPRNKRLDPLTNDRKSTWADIVSIADQETQIELNTQIHHQCWRTGLRVPLDYWAVPPH